VAQEIEISDLDLRYESYRMKDAEVEGRLLASMAACGIQQPLEVANGHILLNGFKRLRCARKLRISILPYACLGTDEAVSIMELLRGSTKKPLSILEQAAFVSELHTHHQLDIAEIAKQLDHGKSWVSMRLHLMAEMPVKVKAKLFSGAFPVYSYMYTLRRFMRMNEAKTDIEAFVLAVSGKGLSLREIEQLAHCFFRGPASLRVEIRKGNVALPLSRMQQIPEDADRCSESERILLNDLELVNKYMQRVMGKLHALGPATSTFYAQSNIVTASVLSKISPFRETLRGLHDRSGIT
jgi:hypothetical protein